MRKLAAMTLLALLAGCGQTGPLYLPGEAPPEEQAPPPVEPAPEEPATSPEPGAS